MKEACQKQTIITEEQEEIYPSNENEVFIVTSTGATVTSKSSIALLNQYVSKLPSDQYSPLFPEFEYHTIDNQFTCTLQLPSNAAFREISLEIPYNSQKKAKEMICLKACEKLHQLGGKKYPRNTPY